RPLPIQEFLGEEGFNANGVAANFFLPSFSQNSTLSASADVLTGGNIAISPDLSARIAYLGHLLWYHTLNDANSIQLGFSTYYHPASSDVQEADFYGSDFLYRWKPIRQGEWKSFLLGGELFWARKAYPDAQESPDVALSIQQQNIPAGTGK